MTDDEQRQLDGVRAELVREFHDRLTAEQVQERFEAVVSEFSAAPIRTYVPVLAQRQVRAELRRDAPVT